MRMLCRDRAKTVMLYPSSSVICCESVIVIKALIIIIIINCKVSKQVSKDTILTCARKLAVKPA